MALLWTGPPPGISGRRKGIRPARTCRSFSPPQGENERGSFTLLDRPSPGPSLLGRGTFTSALFLSESEAALSGYLRHYRFNAIHNILVTKTDNTIAVLF